MKSTLKLHRWQCVTLILVGLATLVSRAAMDVYQGVHGMPLWTPEWYVQIWQMLLPSIYVLIFSGVIGTAIHYRAWVVSAFLVAGIGVFLFFSTANNLDFLSTQTIAKSDAARSKADQAKDIAAIQNEEALKERRELRESLWRTYTITKKQDEKERVLEQIKKVTETPVSLQQVQVEPVQGNGGAILQRLTGINSSVWAEAKTLALPIAFMICEIFAIALGVGAWPPAKVGLTGQDGIPPNTTENAQIWQMSANKLGKQESLADLRQIFPSRTHDLTAPYLAARWGLTGEGVRQRLKDWEDHKWITTDKRKTDRGTTLYVKTVTQPAPVLVSDNTQKKTA